MESDWKKFRELVPLLRERYLAEQNLRISRMLTKSSKTETERFWDAFEVMEREVKTLRACLDGHSRSKMWFYMVTMRSAGMLKKEDLAPFSEELQKQVFDDVMNEAANQALEPTIPTVMIPAAQEVAPTKAVAHF